MGVPLYQYLRGKESLVLPVPFVNVINGGAHANNSIDIQEYMIVPIGLKSFSEAVRCSSEIFQNLIPIEFSQNLHQYVV